IFEESLKYTAADSLHFLLCNGFSRACRNNIFSYSTLYEKANFKSLSPNAKKAFGILRTTDFEIVMKALKDAASLVVLYSKRNRKLVSKLEQDANGLKDVLVSAIASNHPKYPAEINDE